MTPTALHAGLTRGMIELRQSFSAAGLVGHLFWPTVTLVVIFFLRHRDVAGVELPLGALVMPSVLGMFVAFGVLLVIQFLAADREDGTLLRAKTIPGGIASYVVGKLVNVSATILFYLAILLGPGLVIVNGLQIGRAGSWLSLASVVLLGLVATQSIGVTIGALIASPRTTGFVSVFVMCLAGISGIFYPITALPQWLQWVAQAFPMYWLGLGMRSALLPDSAVTVEIGQSWRPVETLTVLGAWALIGLIAAPIMLGAMARKESGSRLAERRHRVLGRAG